MTGACRVSVVLVTYGRAQFLSRTIDSILAQSYADFELIVCDDCSPDHTESVVRGYLDKDPRVRYHRNPVNLGMPGNLNVGIRMAQGEYVADLHDGDVYDPALIEKWVGALEACPKAGFVFNAYRTLDRQWNADRIYRESLPCCFPGDALMKEYFRRWRFGSPVWGTVMVRKAVYDELGLLDERFGFYADIDMWMRIATHYWVAYVDEPLISLPSRERVPRLFDDRVWSVQRMLEKIFWEGRMRYFACHPVWRRVEVLRHLIYVAVARVYLLGTWLHHKLRTPAGR
jgi:glycosyltransferase involved in cell wall biosynthesis